MNKYYTALLCVVCFCSGIFFQYIRDKPLISELRYQNKVIKAECRAKIKKMSESKIKYVILNFPQ